MADKVQTQTTLKKAEQPTYNLRSFNQTITNPNTQKYLEEILHERKGAFVSNLTALVANNVNLQECEPYTLMFAALKATALNLPIEPSLGMAHVIPYRNKKRGTVEAQFQLGYKGFQQLALRTGQYKTINTTEVRQGEIKKRNRLTGEIEWNFIEDEAERLKTPIVGYVNYFKLLNGFESTFYMSKEEAEAHAMRYSQTYRSSYEDVKNQSKWTTDFDAMAMKTVIKLNLSKNGVLSVELADAIRADQSIMRDENKYEYVDNDDSQQQIIDAQKAQAVADKFNDF
jgi:recombination protein RecT